MKEKTIKNILYFLLIVAGVLIVGYTEYQQIQEDIQAQEDCRVQDTEEQNSIKSYINKKP